MIVLTQYMTSQFLVDKDISLLDTNLFILAISTVIIAAAGYIINDYYDVKIDLINKPQRVVIGTQLKRRPVLFFQIFLNVLGIILGGLISWYVLVVNLLSAGLLWMYSNYLKRTPLLGNIVIGILTGLSLYVVGICFHEYSYDLIIYSGFAIVITLVREIIKDMEDVKGDKTFGSFTLPIWLGIRRTKWIIYSIILLFLVLVFNFLVNSESSLLWFYFFVMLVPFVHFLVLLYRADTIRRFSFLSAYAKGIMLLGIISMILV